MVIPFTFLFKVRGQSDGGVVAVEGRVSCVQAIGVACVMMGTLRFARPTGFRGANVFGFCGTPHHEMNTTDRLCERSDGQRLCRTHHGLRRPLYRVRGRNDPIEPGVSCGINLP